MKNIVKIFVEMDVADFEGRRSAWETVDKTYEDAIIAMKDNPFINAVRVVEKTFNPDTFKITYKVLKEQAND